MTPDPHIVPADLPRYLKASFICEHDLFQVIFIILYAIEHFQGKCFAFGSVIWFEFLQNHLIGIKLQSFIFFKKILRTVVVDSPSYLDACQIDFLGLY